MEINEGMVSTEEYFRRYSNKLYAVKKPIKIKPWQDLASRICEELKVPKKEHIIVIFIS